MYGVTVEGTATGLFVFKIDDIPDCRYIRNIAYAASNTRATDWNYGRHHSRV